MVEMEKEITTHMSITFKKLGIDDLPILYKWLNLPHVHEWYDKDKENSLEAVTKRYAPKIRGEKPTDCYLAFYENKPFAYVQTYKVNDWPEFGDHVGYDDFTASVDLFIGEKKHLSKGLGKVLLKKFLSEIIFTNTSATNTCIIGPEPSNERAIHVYKSVGFKHVKDVLIPGEDAETYIMEVKRDEFR